MSYHKFNMWEHKFDKYFQRVAANVAKTRILPFASVKKTERFPWQLLPAPKLSPIWTDRLHW